MTHKYGILIPQPVDEVLEIDQATGTDLWTNAVKKETIKVKFS